VPVTAEEWHVRFRAQADWTRQLRTYVLEENLPHPIDNILEVGSGTSAVLSDYFLGSLENEKLPLASNYCMGVDLNAEYLSFSSRKYPSLPVIQADGCSLPVRKETFSATFCHYTLLWCVSPESLISEMIRVTKKGGLVAAFAEPDYLGSIYFPDLLEEIKLAQIEELEASTADPGFGRKLPGLFHRQDLVDVHYGLFGYSWKLKDSRKNIEDLANYQIDDFAQVFDDKKVAKLWKIEFEAQQSVDYLKYVPTFYAWGKKKN
jgi:ubiquinone/menaquinone biosynthesis C-methylase UbiE